LSTLQSGKTLPQVLGEFRHVAVRVDAFQELADVLCLPPVKHPCLDQRKATFRHFDVLSRRAFLDMKQLFLSLPFRGDAVLTLPARDAADTAGFQRQPQVFIPMLRGRSQG
jgi:hypothetical protein